MTDKDALLDTDWADAWESLPEAPPLVPHTGARPDLIDIRARASHDPVPCDCGPKDRPYDGVWFHRRAALPRIEHVGMTQAEHDRAALLALIDAAPAAEPVPLTLDALNLSHGAIEYDEQGHYLTWTDRLGPDEYGATALIATGVSKEWARVILAALARPEPSAPTETEPKS